LSRARLLVVGVLALALAAFFAAGGQRYFSFENLKAQQAALESWREAYPWQAALGFFALFVAFTAVSLPGAMLLTITGGAVFGFTFGTLIASFAAVLGSTIAFLAARFVFRDWVQARLGSRLEGIARGVAEEGGFHLFTLRLIPGVPYFLINLAMAVSPVGVWTFYWVSQIAMLPSTVLYANAGTQLARLESPHDVLSGPLIGALALLGFFPLAAKKAIDLARARRMMSR
jgi:uncharacterized membrane protein YdjX (TVP38/TMEM64 family)